ncbi:MAG: hypothetical protein ACYDBB_13785 [Armatimonadota bacterium]
MTDVMVVQQFEKLGAFYGRGSNPAKLVGPGPEGTERFYVNYFYSSSTDLVAYHPDSERYDMWTSPQGGAWAMEVSPQGCIYLGTFHQGHVLKLDPQTGVFTDLGQAVPGEVFIWCFSLGADGRIYGGTSSTAHLICIDPATDVVTDLGRIHPEEKYLRTICAAPDGWVYCGIGFDHASLIAYHPASGERRELQPAEERKEGCPSVYRGEDGNAYASYNERHVRLCDGDALSLPQAAPTLCRTRWADGRDAAESAAYPGSHLVLHRVGEGPDGNIYASSILPEYLFRYSPATGECVTLGLIPGAEAYSFLNAYDRLFIASYTHGTLQIYDPAKPFDPGVARDPSLLAISELDKNPANYGPMAPHQQRPYDMVLGKDGNVYVGSVAGYGYFDGAIAWYDPKADRIDYVMNPIAGHGIMAFCVLPDGQLAVGTESCGLPDTSPDGVLFCWNPETKAIASEVLTPFPGEPGVDNLALGDDGLLYGSARQQLFVLDPTTFTILARTHTPLSHVRRAGLHTLEDGRVIMLAGPSAYFLSYQHDEWQLEEFARYDDGWPWTGKAVLDGYLYAGSSVDLIRCKIPRC